MNESLNRYLDGEMEADELAPEMRREGDAWEALFTDARRAGSAGAPVGLESMIMDSIRAESEPPLARLVGWWVNPHPVRIRPLIGLAAAAAIGAFLFLPGGSPQIEEPIGASTTMVGPCTFSSSSRRRTRPPSRSPGTSPAGFPTSSSRIRTGMASGPAVC